MAPERLREQLKSLQIDRSQTLPPSSRRTLWIWLAVALMLGAAGLFLWGRGLGQTATVEVGYARVAGEGAPLQGTALSGAGYVITGDKYIAIGVRVPGRIERYRVDEGDRVEVGQVLVELDDRDYQAQMGRAEASLRVAAANRNLARSQLRRIETLHRDGITSAEELDQARSRYEVAAAGAAEADNDLVQARVNLEDTVLRSPVSGVVLAKLKGVGEIAVPGGFAGAGDLLRIADLSELRAEIDVSEVDLANVRLDQQAEVVPDAYPTRRYHARVVKLHPQVNRQKGTLTVEVRIEDPDTYLLPDMSVRVSFLTAPASSGAGGEGSAILAPRAAIRRDAGGSWVWVVRQENVRRQAVVTGLDIGDEVEIRDGLTGGEALVIGGADGLAEGARVHPRGPSAS